MGIEQRRFIQFTNRQDDSCGLSSVLFLGQQEVEVRHRTKAAFTYGVICKIVCHDVDILDGLTESTIAWEASIRLSRFSFWVARGWRTTLFVCLAWTFFFTTWLAS